MLKYSKPVIVWVVGSPRSGTSFLTDYLGIYADHCFNEPWKTHPLGKHKNWIIPTKSTVIFKYCANSIYHKEISNLYPDSKWVHIKRNPFHVLYSMCFPKNDSWPKRGWSEMGDDIDSRVRNAFYKWSFVSGASDSIKESMTVNYEDIDVEGLAKFTGLPLLRKELGFKNRNLNYDKEKMDRLIRILKKNHLYDFTEDRSGKL